MGGLLRGIALLKVGRKDEAIEELSKVGFKEMNQEKLFYEALSTAYWAREEDIFNFLYMEYKQYPRMNKETFVIVSIMSALVHDNKEVANKLMKETTKLDALSEVQKGDLKRLKDESLLEL